VVMDTDLGTADTGEEGLCPIRVDTRVRAVHRPMVNARHLIV
jgi:hypothetical protein